VIKRVEDNERDQRWVGKGVREWTRLKENGRDPKRVEESRKKWKRGDGWKKEEERGRRRKRGEEAQFVLCVQLISRPPQSALSARLSSRHICINLLCQAHLTYIHA
jgi:hypothetical protein